VLFTICLIVFYYIWYEFYCIGYVLLYVYCIGYVLLYCLWLFYCIVFTFLLSLNNPIMRSFQGIHRKMGLGSYWGQTLKAMLPE
jgi:hypothetical protein